MSRPTVKSFRQTLAENAQQERNLAAMTEGLVEHKRKPPELVVRALKPKRASVALPGESEADIRRSIMSLLRHHPKIHDCWTQGSGNFLFENANGSKRMFRANSKRGMADIQAILKGSGRAIFIEVKTAKGRVMEHQQEFLNSMKAAGAVAFVARSTDDVLNALEGVA